jgi:isopenicillin-N N-acyltransferase-like protein
MRIVEVDGTGTDRGTGHGEELRPLVADALTCWRESVAAREKCPPSEYVADFLASTGFARTLERTTPELYDEIAGIARGAGQPFGDVLVYNLMDEQWQQRRRRAGAGCSVIGVTRPDGAVVLAQNMDLPASMEGSQVVLRILAHSNDPEQLVMTAAGIIGLLGVNRAGVACCVNALSMLPSSTSGLPVSAVIRRMLTHRSAAAAGAELASLTHASGQHYALADAQGVRGFECSATGCVAGPAEPDLLHTNHPLWGPSGPAVPQPDAVDSAGRMSALVTGLDGVRGSGDALDLLSSTANGLCVVPSPAMAATTFCSAEFTMTRPPSVRVALGRPDLVQPLPVPWSD